MNLPLVLSDKIRTRRTKANLIDKLPERLNYFILDVDDVRTLDAQKRICEYFSKYRCVICESRSHNGIDNFNLKGVVECDLSCEQLQMVIDQIFFDLVDYGTIDRSVVRCPTFNAPIGKYQVIYDTVSRESAHVLRFSDFDISITNKNKKFAIELKMDDLTIENSKTVADMCLSVFQQQGFRAIGIAENGGVRFSHPSEVKTPGGYIWFNSYPYVMRHFNSTKNVSIKEFIQSLPQFKNIKAIENGFLENFGKEEEYGRTIEVNERYLHVTDKILDAIHDFIDTRDGLFTIHSPMGTGKSTIIAEIIRAAIQDVQSVLLVTPRISVANDFKNKYGLKLYNQDKYEVGDSLICQYDSLCHYNLRCFDVIIYDEFCSTFIHSRTGINNGDVRLFSIFMATFLKKVVIADAFITGFDSIFKKDFSKKFLIKNSYRDNTEIFFYAHANTLKEKICQEAQCGKISVSTTSLAFGKACAIVLEKLGCRVCTIFGDTPDNLKNAAYKWLSDKNDDHFDALIYSPTVTVGISIEVPIRTHFHYDCGRTCDAISSLQMLKRVRSAEEIHCYIQNIGQYLLIRPQQIMDDWLSNLNDKDKVSSWLFTCNDYGELHVSKRGKMVAEIDARINAMRSNYRRTFLGLLKYQFSGVPTYVANFIEFNRFKKYETMNAQTCQKMLELMFKQFLEMNDIERLSVTSAEMERVIDVDSCIRPVDKEIKIRIFGEVIADYAFPRKCALYNLVVQSREGKLKDSVLNDILATVISKNDTETYMFLSDLKKCGEIRDVYKSKELPPNVKFITSKIGYKIRQCGDGTQEYSVPESVKELACYIIPKW